VTARARPRFPAAPARWRPLTAAAALAVLAAVAVADRERFAGWRRARTLARAEAELARGDFRRLAQRLAAAPAAAYAGTPLAWRRLRLAAALAFQRGEVEEAERLLARSVTLAGGDVERAQATTDHAVVLAGGLDRLARAALLLAPAAASAARAGAAAIESEALARLSDVVWRQTADAARCRDDFLVRAAAISRRAGDRRGEARAYHRLGLLELAGGAYAASADALTKAERLYADAGDLAGTVDVGLALGALDNAQRRSRPAFERFRRGRELAETLDYRRGAQLAARLLADHTLRGGDYAGAIDLAEAALAAAVPPLPAERRRLLALIGSAALHLGDSDRSLQSYRALLAFGPADADHALRGQAMLMIGNAHLERGDVSAADAAFTEAAAGAARRQDWGQLVLVTLARADLADRLDRRAEALAALRAAADVEAATLGSTRTFFYRSQYWQVYRRLQRLLAEAGEGSAEQEEAAALLFRFLEQMRYRAFRSMLVRGAERHDRGAAVVVPAGNGQAVEAIAAASVRTSSPPGMLAGALERYEAGVVAGSLDPQGFAPLRRARPVELAALQAHLDEETAVVEYLFAEEDAFALFIGARRLAWVPLPLPRAALEAKARLLATHLRATGRRRFDAVARDLDAALVEPLRQRGLLAGIRRLGIVPMAFLAEVPFAALIQPAEGATPPRHLVETHALFYAPSASVLASRWEQVDSSASRAALALGHGRAGNGLAALPQAEPEAARTAALLGGEALLGPAASEAALARRAAAARVLHLAAHAVAEPSAPAESRLLLGPGGGEDGALTAREILALPLQANLVTLSGCRTGLSYSANGNDLAEDDRTGLVEAFLHAGARNVLASLWPVADRPTARLMDAFYRRTLAGERPVEALAGVQRQAILAAAAGPGHVDAATWAAFMIVGAP
jgi:CHAT domain-containing protein